MTWDGYLVEGMSDDPKQFLEVTLSKLKEKDLPKVKIEPLKIKMWKRDALCIELTSKLAGTSRIRVYAMSYGVYLFAYMGYWELADNEVSAIFREAVDRCVVEAIQQHAADLGIEVPKYRMINIPSELKADSLQE